MTISDVVLEQIKTISFKKFPDPSILHQPMDVGLWVLWLLQDYFELDNHFTTAEISQVLLKRKISFSAEEITKGFARSDKKIHKETNEEKKPSYMILQAGKEYLTKLLPDGFGNNDEFFSQFDGGGIHAFFLLQIDLANHTKWFGEKKPEKNLVKKELAMDFTNELKNKYQFHRLFWAGDGGVFVRTSEATPNYDVVIDAADTIYALFEKWKKKNNKLETKLLNIRVSAHISQIFADKDPGFWTSEDLNNFIKYERNISEKGFAVTKQIRDLLSAEKQKRFDIIMEEIKNKDGITVMQISNDSIHKLK